MCMPLTGILLHTATAILLFLVLWRMTAALWRSAIVAAVFAIHPLRVESVAWIAERKDVLSAFFFVLTIAAYARYAARPALGRYALVLLLSALGLMCKPMLVTLPFVLLLLDYWPLRRWPNDSRARNLALLRSLALEKIPLLALAVVSATITLFAQAGVMQPVAAVSLSMRFGNAVTSYVIYLRQLFWPTDLAAFYPITPQTVTIGTTLLGLILLAGVSLVCVRATNRRYLLTGWCWYLLMLVPVIGIVQVGIQAHADRYTYLPHIGLYMVLTWGASDLLSRLRHQRLFSSALAGAVIATLALCARSQASYRKDSETLWRITIARTPANAIAHLNLGGAPYEQGKLVDAVKEYEIALRSKAVEAQAHSALGVALLEAGEPMKSIAHLELALQIAPNYAEAHYNLGNTFLQSGQEKEAVVQYSRAIELNPQDIEAQSNLAWLLATSLSPAVRDGAKAVTLSERVDLLTGGKNQIIAATLAAAYAEIGRFADAVRTARRARDLALAEGKGERAQSISAQMAQYESQMPMREPR